MTPPTSSAPDLAAAADAVAVAQSAVDTGIAALAGAGGPDRAQVLAYDVAHAAAAVRTAEAVLAYGSYGGTEAGIACAFVADAVCELASRTAGRAGLWGVEPDWMSPAGEFVTTFRDPSVLATLAEHPGERHLDADFELVRETFHRFAEEQIRPRAEHIHRANTDIPEEIISGLAEMGGFGMSVPEEYGGFATGGESDYMGMVVATEELSWGSLGAGGSLITRPEILTRAIVHGGTEEQKRHWLPKLAGAEVLGAVAVTEPDFGSDVASVVTSAVPVEGGWLING
ncbi:MAG: acyl-CoA dehydrogenase family protein, partial [Acidimicrobiales bacterium]